MDYANSTKKPALLWGHVDCNSFYCSCERLFRPDLKGKPVVVLSNNDGCLIALTPEAKALGFKLGDVYFHVADALKRHKVAVFSSNYTLYGDLSDRVMQTMATLVPVDQYSIDEAFVPFEPAMAAQVLDVGWAVHDRIRQWTGIPVGVGIGATRTLAKLANHWTKKLARVLYLELGSPELEQVLEDTPVRDVWGMGRKQSAKLADNDIYNARQLRDMDLDRALKLLTVVGQNTVYELRGLQCIQDDVSVRKTLVSTRSFGRRVTRKEDIAEGLAMHAGIAARRLRDNGLTAGVIAIQCTTSPHAVKPYHRMSGQVRLPVPTNATDELIRAAHAALDACYEPGHEFLKAGVFLFDIAPENARQLTLAEACARPENTRSRKLMQAVDAINDRYGRDTVHHAAQGRKDAFWRIRRDRMSPRYTTRVDELLEVR